MSFINEAPDTEKKLSLIETLRTVTEGKVQSCEVIFEIKADRDARYSLRSNAQG